MSGIGEDKANPFARPSPWPGASSATMRLTVPRTNRPAQAAQPDSVPPETAPPPEPEPPPAAPAAPAAQGPRFIVVDTPSLARPAPVSPRLEPRQAAPVETPRAEAPPPAPEPPVLEALVPELPVVELPVVQPSPAAEAPAAEPLARPVLRERRPAASRRPRGPGGRMRLAPLIGAAAAGLAAVGVLALVMGRERAPAPAPAAAAGLQAGQVVAPVATLEPAKPAPQLDVVLDTEPVAAAPNRPAARTLRAEARTATAAVEPTIAPTAQAAPAPPAPPPTAAPLPTPIVVPPAAAPAAAPVAPAATYAPPAPPAADAPFQRHVPD
jgi:hypothetical protein